MPRVFTKADIIAVNDVKVVPVEVPEWGEDVIVYVRVWDTAARDAYEKRYGNKQTPDDESFRAYVASISVCDEQGKLVFSKDDVAELSKKSWKAMQRIFTAAIEANAITQAQKEELKKT